MLNSRSRISVLILLTIAHSVAGTRMLFVLAGVTFFLALFHFQSVRRGAWVIAITTAALLIWGFIIRIVGVSLPARDVFIGMLRILSLTVLTISLFLSLNALELVTGLTYFKVPFRIALALGIGFRFIPIILDEAKRTRLVRRQRGLMFSRVTLRRVGLTGTLSRVIAPLVVALLRRVDSLIISIAVQQLPERVRLYRFPPWRAVDIIVSIGAAGITLASCVAA